jgi:hypothetical protein
MKGGRAMNIAEILIAVSLLLDCLRKTVDLINEVLNIMDERKNNRPALK